jgi:hypothetical protein
MPGNLSLKAVCPGCGQWLRLPEHERIDPPAAAPEMMRQMHAQARMLEDVGTVTVQPLSSAAVNEDYEVVDDVDEPGHRKRRESEPNEDDARRRRPRKWRRSEVRAMVYYPALALTIVAYGGAGLTILATVIQIGQHLANSGAPESTPPASDAVRTASMIGFILRLPITLLWSRYLISAADSLECLQEYRKVIVACAVAMLPCSLGCVGGIPVALWILVVMLLPEVRRAFSS